MQERKASQSDLRFIYKNLAERSKDEIETAGYSVADVKEVFRGLRAAGKVWALEHNNQLLAVIAFQDAADLDGLPYTGTYFLGTEAFFEPDVPSARFGRRFMRERQRELGNLPMVSMCYGTHPEIERWYRLMGYRLAEEIGVQRNFVLDPAVVSTAPETLEPQGSPSA